MPSSSWFAFLSLVCIDHCCILLTNIWFHLFAGLGTVGTLRLKDRDFGLPTQPSQVCPTYRKGPIPNVELVMLSYGYDSGSGRCLVVKLFRCLVWDLGFLQFVGNLFKCNCVNISILLCNVV